jgi:hypothetical protein
MLMRQPVLDVDHAHYAIACDHRRRKKRLEGIFLQLAKRLEPRILVRLARNRQQPALPRHPAGESFVGPHAQLADGRRVRPVGSAQHQFLAVQQVHEAGIALGILHHQRYNALKNLAQAHFPNHKAADLLEQTQLLLGPLQSQLEILGLRHEFIIAAVPRPPYRRQRPRRVIS